MMNADELGIALTELDKEFNDFVKVFQAKRAALKQMYSATAKYPVGYKFQHPLHGEITVTSIHVWEGKKGTYDLSGVSVYDDPYYLHGCQSVYEPFYVYECLPEDGTIWHLPECEIQ